MPDEPCHTWKIQVLNRGKKAYVAAIPDVDGYRSSVALKRRFKIVRRKNRLGGACYRLLSR